MKRMIIILALVFASSLVFTSCKSNKTEAVEEKIPSSKTKVADKSVYQCPMKCEKEKTYNKEGECPVCKMKLKKTHIETNNTHEGHK